VREVEQTDKQVGGLAEAADKVGSIVTLIDEIASMTTQSPWKIDHLPPIPFGQPRNPQGGRRPRSHRGGRCDAALPPEILVGFRSRRASLSKLKASLRHAAERSISALYRGIGSIAIAFSPHECANYFRHAGYAPTRTERFSGSRPVRVGDAVLLLGAANGSPPLNSACKFTGLAL